MTPFLDSFTVIDVLPACLASLHERSLLSIHRDFVAGIAACWTLVRFAMCLTVGAVWLDVLNAINVGGTVGTCKSDGYICHLAETVTPPVPTVAHLDDAIFETLDNNQGVPLWNRKVLVMLWLHGLHGNRVRPSCGKIEHDASPSVPCRCGRNASSIAKVSRLWIVQIYANRTKSYQQLRDIYHIIMPSPTKEVST